MKASFALSMVSEAFVFLLLRRQPHIGYWRYIKFLFLKYIASKVYVFKKERDQYYRTVG
jgi:hypothetical protein